MNQDTVFAPASHSRVSSNWIISRRTDLTCFIGGSMAAYALFLMHAGLGWDMVGIWFIWVTLLDGPHFFGTISRTYLDKKEFSERRRLLLWSLLWFAFGPVALVLAFVFYRLGASNYVLPWKLCLIFLNLWAYWHVVRQHYGFMRLYQIKNSDTDPIDARLDSGLLYAGLLLPFVAFIVRHPEVRSGLGLNAEIPATSANMNSILEAWPWEHWVLGFCVAGIVCLVLLFAVRQIYKLKVGEKVNLPKILFLLSVVPLHIYVCFSPAVLEANLLIFSAFVTVFHDIQYHALVWFHHRNRYHREGIDARQFGVAPWFSRNFFSYAASALFFTAWFRVLGCSLSIHPGCTPLLITSDIALFGEINADSLLFSILMGFALHHYFVDQYIWRTRQNKTLREDLKLEAA